AFQRELGPVPVQALALALTGALAAGDDADPALPAVDPARAGQGPFDRRKVARALGGAGRFFGFASLCGLQGLLDPAGFFGVASGLGGSGFFGLAGFFGLVGGPGLASGLG